MTQAIAYLRVSTEDQAEHGYGLPSQREDIQKFADKEDLHIVNWIADEGISGGTKFEDREGGKAIYNAITDKVIDAVIIARYDRFSRSKYLTSFSLLQETLDKHGVDLYFADRGKVEDDFTLSIMTLFDQHKGYKDKLQIAENTRKGRIERAKAGHIPCNGFPPLGYRKEFYMEGNKQRPRFAIDEVQAETVRTIFRLYTEEKLSLGQVCTTLDERGTPTPGRGRPGRGNWGKSTLRSILKNKIYYGRYIYGKSETKHLDVDGQRRKIEATPEDQRINIDVPELAIITKETYDTAQERLSLNRRIQKRNRKSERVFLLTPFMKCECGRGVYGKTRHNHKGHDYYCNSSGDRKYDDCKNQYKSKSAPKLERQVFHEVYRMTHDQEYIRQQVDSYNAETQSERDNISARIQALEKVAETHGRKAENLVNIMSDITDQDGLAIYKDQVSGHVTQKNSALAEIESLEARLVEPIDADEVLDIVMLWGESDIVGFAMRTTNEEQKEMFISSVNQEIMENPSLVDYIFDKVSETNPMEIREYFAKVNLSVTWKFDRTFEVKLFTRRANTSERSHCGNYL